MVQHKLNAQGLARGHKGLMSALVPPPGEMFVSCDLSSGEPTVTSHYSGDKNYRDACFDMVGKDPYYDGGLLRIDDIYLMVMSQSPFGKDRLREVVESTFDGLTFVQQWQKDKEHIQKKVLKKERALHKALALGISYSMGPKKLVKVASDNGHPIGLQVAKGFYNAYWETFSGVYALGERLKKVLAEKGYLVNDFGYRLVPKEDYKALNYFIQSSVSGIINVLYQLFFKQYAPYCKFVTVIHDELIFSCPVDRLTEAKEAMKNSEKGLNNMLNWTVNVRVGWAQGEDLYSAK